VVLFMRAPPPVAVLSLPVVLRLRALSPVAVLVMPVVFLKSDTYLSAVFSEPVVLRRAPRIRSQCPLGLLCCLRARPFPTTYFLAPRQTAPCLW
jgi:hypothetical protein